MVLLANCTLLSISKAIEVKPEDPLVIAVSLTQDQSNNRRYNLMLAVQDSSEQPAEVFLYNEWMLILLTQEDEAFDGHEKGCDCARCKVIRAFMEDHPMEQ
jgi:hypothetical protein